MGNSYFQFRQFRIEQGRSALKVCTDSCIFAAFVADMESRREVHPRTVLDAGAGTGLLSLMLAQKLPGIRVSAIENHEGSYLDCLDNFQASPWKERMDCQFISLEEFKPAEPFEMIVCNPPFFLDHLESPESGRNVSKHRTVHDLRNWLVRLEKLCITQGRIWLMLNPDSYAKTAQVLSDLGLSVTTNLVLSQSGNRIWRNILCLEKKVNPLSETLEQPVYEEGMNLHPVVKNWLKDYYLK